MRVDVKQFFEVAGQAMTGQLLGQIHGDQQRRQREEEAAQRRRKALLDALSSEEMSDRQLASTLSLLDRDSQALTLQHLAERAAAREATMRRFLAGGSELPPPAPPATGSASPSGRSFRVPGLGALTLRGVDPKQAEAMRRMVAERVKFLSSLDAGPVTKPQIQATLGALPATFDSDSDYRAGQEFLTQTAPLVPGGALQLSRLRSQEFDRDRTALTEALDSLNTLDDQATATSLPGLLDAERDLAARAKDLKRILPGSRLEASAPDIERIREMLASGDTDGAATLARKVSGRLAARLTPTQEATRLRRVESQIAGLSIPQANRPDLIRRIYRAAGLEYLLAGLTDADLRLGQRRSEERYSQLLARLPSFADLNTPAKRALLRELHEMAAAAGKRVVIPEDVTRTMRPEVAARLRNESTRLQITQERAAAQRIKDAAATRRLTPEEQRILDAYLRILLSGRTETRQIGERKTTVWVYNHSDAEREQALRGLETLGRAKGLPLGGIGGLEDYPPPTPGAPHPGTSGGNHGHTRSGTRRKERPTTEGQRKVKAQMDELLAGKHVKPPTLSAGDRALIRGYIRAGKFQILLRMPQLQDPKVRAAAIAEYEKLTGKRFGGK